MQAMVKQDYRWNSVRVGGLEFVKSELRPVPDAVADEARCCPVLEIVEPEAEPEPEAKPRKAKPKGGA